MRSKRRSGGDETHCHPSLLHVALPVEYCFARVQFTSFQHMSIQPQIFIIIDTILLQSQLYKSRVLHCLHLYQALPVQAPTKLA